MLITVRVNGAVRGFVVGIADRVNFSLGSNPVAVISIVSPNGVRRWVKSRLSLSWIRSAPVKLDIILVLMVILKSTSDQIGIGCIFTKLRTISVPSF